jgi:phenylacetate-coenzyme A ligase PaaK-like adenylate-forming protein
MGDGQYYDALETRESQEREVALFDALRAQIADACVAAPGWVKQLDGVVAEKITTREALSQLPLLRKSSLKQFQQDAPPFGGFVTSSPGDVARIFMSPGPIFEPEGKDDDWWGVARALYAAGARPGDLIHNSFAYHMTPAGHMFENGAHALGCCVIPAGVGNTEMQVEAIAALKSRGYSGTPDFLKVLLDKADELGTDISCLQIGLVSGAALPPSLRGELGERGVNVVQCYGTAELGIVAYESTAREGMIINENYLVEIVVPGTGDPVEEGEIGEVVVSRINRDYPMIRFATGDLSAVLSGLSPCGRTNMRIKGWMGRADQTTKVKGMFVHPEHVAEIAKSVEGIDRVRFVVTRDNEQDVLTVKVESTSGGSELSDEVSAMVRSVCKVRGTIAFVAPGSLPKDGIVIADERKYE